jgi:large subunit ribosomal protein L25
MKRYNLAVDSRTETGTVPNLLLRFEGKIPAIMYGAGSEPEKVALNYREFEKLMSGSNAENGLINLSGAGIAGGESVAVIREIQRDPLSRRYLHVDLYRVRMDQQNDFEVAVHGVGVPVGVREGGLLETHLRAVTVRCLPNQIPDVFNVNLVDLKVNQSYHVRDIPLPEGVAMVTEGEETLFTVITVRGDKTAAATEGAPAAPEVVGKKKADEEKKA